MVQKCKCGCGAPVYPPIYGKDRFKGFLKGHNYKAKFPDVRFWTGIKLILGSVCWIWRRNSCNGYGTFQLNGKMIYVHRWAYEYFFGPIPEGMKVLHSCDNPKCVNPEHLSLGTDRDNTRDCIKKGRAWWQNYRSERLDSVLAILRSEGGFCRPKHLAPLLGRRSGYVAQVLRVLTKKGLAVNKDHMYMAIRQKENTCPDTSK